MGAGPDGLEAFMVKEENRDMKQGQNHLVSTEKLFDAKDINLVYFKHLFFTVYFFKIIK